jgi:hypothetical protein
MLDSELHNKARDTYIETLLDLTDATDNLLTWYRTLLTSRVYTDPIHYYYVTVSCILITTSANFCCFSVGE